MCPRGKFTSSRADHLKIHMKTHSGEKSNKCNQCDFAFSEWKHRVEKSKTEASSVTLHSLGQTIWKYIWTYFMVIEWQCLFFFNDGVVMVFENFLPSPSMVFGGINHRQRWFFDGFAIFGNQWLTMVTEEKMHISRQTQIHNKLQVNIKSQTQHDSKILFCQFTQNIPLWFQVCNRKTCYQHIFWKLVFVFLL